MVNIIKSIIPSGQKAQRPGFSMDPNFITIHNTANDNKGADAEMHSRYLHNGGGGRMVGWHFTVDDNEIYQHLPINESGYHAGDGGGDGNRRSIGIEICENSDGDFEKAVNNAQWLVNKLMKDHNISLTNVVSHKHWSGKKCPHKLLSRWGSFIDGIDEESIYVPPKKETKPEKVIKPSAKPSGGSVVDYMNSKGMDASYSNRSKLARQYGISGYKGTASQNITLLSKIKAGAPKKDKPAKKGDMKTGSIVTYLNSIDVNSSYSNRSKLAKRYGISNYHGTASQNIRLLDEIRGNSKPVSKPKPKPKPKKKTVHLPKSAATWRTYKLNVQPVKKNSDWSLTPSAFGGLTYDILGTPYGNIVTIKTGRGKRNIYVGPGTGAQIR